jgi:hypothetical protein
VSQHSGCRGGLKALRALAGRAQAVNTRKPQFKTFGEQQDFLRQAAAVSTKTTRRSVVSTSTSLPPTSGGQSPMKEMKLPTGSERAAGGQPSRDSIGADVRALMARCVFPLLRCGRDEHLAHRPALCPSPSSNS